MYNICSQSYTWSPWGWQVRCAQDELQMRGYQPRSPLSQNSSITSLLHNPNRTVHVLKPKTKQIQSDFSKEPENMHFYVLYIRVVFFHINKYKLGGQKRTKKTKTMISRGVIMNVLGIRLNPWMQSRSVIFVANEEVNMHSWPWATQACTGQEEHGASYLFFKDVSNRAQKHSFLHQQMNG